MRLYGSRALAWFLPAYAAILLLMAPHLSLWLDEVLTLSGAKEPDLAAMLVNLQKQQGATPLAFLIPRWAIQIFGFSLWSTRLPSILAAVAACPAVFLLGRRAGLRQPFAAVLVFALWPLEVRYALEARPYALAVCLSAWLTVLFLERWSDAAYVVLVVALALTHPYGLFLPAAHLLWAILSDRERAMAPALGLALSAAALLPWYLHFQDGWRAISAQQHLGAVNWRAPLVFLREISGSGYVGTALLAIGIAMARPLASARFWWLALAVPMIAVPVANVVFDYFFAVRQLIFLLPLLALLFVAGSEAVKSWGRCLVAAFLIASLYANVMWTQRPREDWSAAADLAASEVSNGACVRFVGDSQKLFVVFHPELAQHACYEDAPRVVIAGSTYESVADDRAAHAFVQGMSKQAEQQFVAPRIEVYAR